MPVFIDRSFSNGSATDNRYHRVRDCIDDRNDGILICLTGVNFSALKEGRDATPRRTPRRNERSNGRCLDACYIARSGKVRSNRSLILRGKVVLGSLHNFAQPLQTSSPLFAIISSSRFMAAPTTGLQTKKSPVYSPMRRHV